MSRSFWKPAAWLMAALALSPTSQAAPISCTQAALCTLDQLLAPGNSLVITHEVFGTGGRRFTETMEFSNFQTPIGNFGDASIAVYAETNGVDWSLVMQPLANAVNPWQIDSRGPSAHYYSLLTYDLRYDGLRVDRNGFPHRQNLLEGVLETSYGAFRNTGGLSLTGAVQETITDARTAQPDFVAALEITCQELELDMSSGCRNKTGTETIFFSPYSLSFDEQDRLQVETRLTLDYEATFGGGGALSVNRITQQFSESRPVSVPEPTSAALALLALAGLAKQRRRPAALMPAGHSKPNNCGG